MGGIMGENNAAFVGDLSKPPSRFVLRRKSTEIVFRELPTRHRSASTSSNLPPAVNINPLVGQTEEEIRKGPSRLLSTLYGLHLVILSLVLTLAFYFAAELNGGLLDIYFLVITSLCILWFISFQPMATLCNRRPSEFGYSKFNHSTNRWLKGVVFIFGFAIFVEDCLQVLAYIHEDPVDCKGRGLGLANPIIQALFVIGQVNFLFKYSKVCVQDKKGFNRLGTMHVLATNLSMWILLIAHESEHHLDERPTYHYTDPHCSGEDHNTTTVVKRSALAEDTCPCTSEFCKAIEQAADFIYPFVVEFSLVASCMMYVVWKNVGAIPHACQRVIKPSYKFYSSYKGVLAGILVLVTTVVMVLVLGTQSSGLDVEERTYCTELKNLIIHNVFLSVLGVLCISACIAGLYLFHKNKRPIEHKEQIHLDEMLLLLTLFGAITINIFYILAVYASMVQEGTFIWGAIYPIVDLTQGAIQVVFILGGLHRQPSTSDESRDMAQLVHNTFEKSQKTGEHLGKTLITDLHSGSNQQGIMSSGFDLDGRNGLGDRRDETSFTLDSDIQFHSTSSSSGISCGPDDEREVSKKKKRKKRKRTVSEKSTTTVVAKLKVSNPDSTRLLIRDIAMFLLIVNACMWLFLSLEETAFNLYSWPQQYYNGSSWAVIISICAPLAIFFRMHSAACLFEIWSFA